MMFEQQLTEGKKLKLKPFSHLTSGSIPNESYLNVKVNKLNHKRTMTNMRGFKK